MAINIFVFKQNCAGSSEVAGMKEIFLPFLIQLGPTVWPQKAKRLLTINSCHAKQILLVKQNTPTPPTCSWWIISKWIENHQNQMKNTCPFYIILQVLTVLLIKFCKTQPPDLVFLAVFISLSFNIIWKKDFCHKFYLLTDSLKPPTTLTAKIR